MGRDVLPFLGWCAVGLVFEGLAAYIWFCKKPASFGWARVPDVTDVKRYNRAVAKLYVAYGAVFVLLGLPLLAKPLRLMAAGVVGEGAACRAVYARVICKKYKKHYGDWRD